MAQELPKHVFSKIQKSCSLHQNFALSFSLIFLSILCISQAPFRQNTPTWASLERSFPPAEVEYGCCQFWSKLMMSEVEERPMLVTAGYWWYRSQWVNWNVVSISCSCALLWSHGNYQGNYDWARSRKRFLCLHFKNNN